MRIGLRLSLLATLLAAAGLPCSAQIHSFRGAPRTICPQTKTITLSWSVDASASLSAETPVDGLDGVVSCGQTTVAAKPATITLTASKLFSRQRNQLIFVALAPNTVEEI